MTWAKTGTRGDRLPSDWAARCAATEARAGYRCEDVTNGVRCPERGSDCDHIVRGDNHNLSNLQWLCAWHHKIKTAAEAAEARREKAKLAKHPRFR